MTARWSASPKPETACSSVDTRRYARTTFLRRRMGSPYT